MKVKMTEAEVKVNLKKRKTWRLGDYEFEMRELNAPPLDAWYTTNTLQNDDIPLEMCK